MRRPTRVPVATTALTQSPRTRRRRETTRADECSRAAAETRSPTSSGRVRDGRFEELILHYTLCQIKGSL